MATNDTIQLMEDAVQNRLPSYATEDDMYEALNNCAMTEQDIYAALERKYGDGLGKVSEEQMAVDIRELLFFSFDLALETVLLGREPLDV